jgi:peptidoglycan/LPS O-acetylase OafA/YrhL
MIAKTSKTIAPLDGIRALAILLVLGMHSKEMLYQVAGQESSLMNIPPFKGGWVGIPLFFSLSGFLIGIQVWEELKSTQNIKFLRFFLKRAFRIWPLFYILYIVFILFPYQSGVTDYLVNALFLSNFFGDNGPIRASWSLATEEQFYILLPFFLKIYCSLLHKKKKQVTLKSVRFFLYFLLFAPIINRYIIWNYYLRMDHFDLTTYMKYIYRPIITHSEGLIAGLILATYYVENTMPKPSKHFGFALVLSSLLIGLFSFYSKVYFNFLGITFSAIILIWFCLSYDSFISKFFSHSLFSLIAKCSFSMYLINWPLLHYMQHLGLIRSKILSLNMQLALNTTLLVVISIIISIFNFKFIENPFLKLRNRILKARYS